MASFDYKLRHLKNQTSSSEDRVQVLAELRDPAAGIEDLQFEVTSRAGAIVAGFVPTKNLDKLSAHQNVISIEAPRPLKDETDVSSVAINLVDAFTSVRTIPTLGKHAVIGIIDSGFDLTHPCFLDDMKQTRILAAWDQVNLDHVNGPVPKPFNYGVEYSQEAINWDIANNRIIILKNRNGKGQHGTWVAGIAAGNGTPHGIFKGIAPEANLILVAYRNDVAVGGSTAVLDAINYIRQKAQAAGKPVVINISQGDSLGAHDGTSLIERAIDQIVSEERVLVVASAGNERGGEARHHAAGKLEAGSDFILSFEFKLNGAPVDGDTIEIWYRGSDRFAVALKSPSGTTSAFIPPGSSAPIEFAKAATAHVFSETENSANGDNHIGIIFDKNEGWEAGKWELILRGIKTDYGTFDAWADRPSSPTIISFESHQSDRKTITLPGNARSVITVGGFISRPEREITTDQVKGELAPGSSIGPTRDGRLKPDLTAPSTFIMAPRMHSTSAGLCYDFTSGTSMAAPHVTGVIALLWSLCPELPGEQIREAVCSHASSDCFTGATPNAIWGNGKLDAERAYQALSNNAEKGETQMSNKLTVKFDTNSANGTHGGMEIRIAVKDDGTLIVGGVSDGEKYVGRLILKKDSVLAGGDQCWINGVWYANCPP